MQEQVRVDGRGESADHVGSRSLLGLLTAGVLAAVAVGMGVGSFSLGLWTDLGPGAGFFPLCLAVTLGCLSVVWGLEQWRAGSKDAGGGEGGDTVQYSEGVPNNLTQISAVFGSLVVLALVLQLLGFQLSMLMFLIFHLRVLGRRRWPLTIALSVVGSVGLFVIFTRLFGVFLPASSLTLLNSLGL